MIGSLNPRERWAGAGRFTCGAAVALVALGQPRAGFVAGALSVLCLVTFVALTFRSVRR